MISIIIPTRNEEGIIGRTITSLQSGLRGISYELIVTDGGSADRTREIARQHGAIVVTDPRPGRQTIARGRNLGAVAASGEILVFMDADVSFLDPEAFFTRALGHFRSPRLAGLTARLRVVREEERFLDWFIFGYVAIVQVIANNILHLGGACGEFQMIRADVFRKLGGYREDLSVAEDNEFFSRLARIGRTKIDPKLTAFHTGRRIRKTGWPRLLWSWFLNGLWVFLFRRSYDRVWSEVR